MSVALGCVLEELGLEPEDVVVSHPGYGLVAVEVGFIRKLGLGVVHDGNDDEPYHGGVYGRKTGKVRSRLRDAAIQNGWIREPDASAAGLAEADD